MGSDPINYEAVLADLEARKAQLESAIAAIKMIGSQGGLPGPNGGGGSTTVGPSDYLAMSIPEATKKYLTTTRQKRSTQDVMKALESGGLPKSKYTTVYSILRRREQQVGDIINMQGDWALAEWYPNYRRRTKEESDAAQEADKTEKKATAAG